MTPLNFNSYEECKGCGNQSEKFKNCEYCAKIKRLEYVDCPSCQSENIKEGFISEDNGVYGSGFISKKTFEYCYCGDCGTMFHNMKPKDATKWIRNYKIKKLIKDE
jgi:hypothetical protein